MNNAPARPIRFVHQGEIQDVSGLPPTTTVLQWLREHAHCTGTKEGCAEGDCGACTVVVAELDAASGELHKRSVNACIQFLPTLDGRALFTVEDLPAINAGELHPCQQAMVACHGSQCGFCTPGFVMSLWQTYEQHEMALPRAALADALSGNLCRCTGYRPILDAGQAMYTAPRVLLDEAPVKAALATLNTDSEPGLVYEGPDAGHPGAHARFMAPTTLDELAALRQAWPQARLLAGSTDIGLWVNKQFKALGDILYLGRVDALKAITPWGAEALMPDGLEIGAGASLEAAWSALSQHIPALREIWLRFASPPVRHVGTLGGNIANGSPIGDGAPVLLALGASVVLRCGTATREMPLSAFYLGYMRNALQAGEFIQSLRVPLPRSEHGEVFRAYKVSKRRDSDISALCAGLMLRLTPPQLESGQEAQAMPPVIAEARLAWGGLAATACRGAATEAALLGQAWNEATLRQAQAALVHDFQPLSDLRASSDYRLKVAANLLERFWLETRPDAPLPACAVQVWPATA
jgi:xanthine dehydrogenase small subunit